jgi:endonuclease/exonuclease/phosphatase family metal-dependent hydrolase
VAGHTVRLDSLRFPRAGQPRTRQGPLRARFLFACLVPLALGISAGPARALKIAAWNVLKYPGTDLATRQPNMRAVIAALDPDVIALQELKSAAGRDSFLDGVLNVVQPGQWSATAYFATCESAIFFKPAKITLTFSGVPIPTSGPVDVLGARIRAAGYLSKLAEIRLYSVHFQAGTEDSATRRLECTDLRNNLNAAVPAVTPNYLVCGDTNFYGTWEGGYLRLTEDQADDDGRCRDPLSMPGTWHQYGYRWFHTQSSCLGGCPSPDWSTGGLNDRPDLFLTSPTLQDRQGLDLVPGTCVAFGNDGQHYDESVNGLGFNDAVGMTVANALLASSDHLPVIVTLQVPARVAAAAALDFGRVLVGAGAQRTLTVADGAVAPADSLNYSLLAPAGFTASAGGFAAVAGGAANPHVIGMATASPATMGGTLVVSCDDPDSTAKPVQLSGVVLAHAAASLDSVAVVTAAILDFGTHASGGFADLPVRVHDAGWSVLRARLELTGGVIDGGGGRFSIVGGFDPVEVGEVGRTYALRFDAAGAVPDSTYEATLVISGADEPLPGAAAAADLVVTLRARTSPPGAAVGGSLPGRTCFHAPGPNPVRGSTQLRFELQRDAEVSIDLLDASGRRVTTIMEGRWSAGGHSIRWCPDVGGGTPGAGLYFVRFRADGIVQTRRLVLTR